MLRAQIGQCAVFKTPKKLHHPYCNSFEAIAIGKLDLVMDHRNVSLFRDLAMEPIFTLRISQPLNTNIYIQLISVDANSYSSTVSTAILGIFPIGC